MHERTGDFNSQVASANEWKHYNAYCIADEAEMEFVVIFSNLLLANLNSLSFYNGPHLRFYMSQLNIYARYSVETEGELTHRVQTSLCYKHF